MKRSTRLKLLVALAIGACSSAGVLTIALADVLWDTGLARYTIFNGAPTYLGFSSGPIAPTAPQRWLAQPFSLVEGATITQVEIFGFEAVGSEFQDVLLRMWMAPDDGCGNALAPQASDLAYETILPQGSNPRGFVDPDAPVDPTLNPGWRWRWPVNVSLPEGRYYLTVAANAPEVPGGTANFAWFGNAPGTNDFFCPDQLATSFIDETGSVPLPGGNPPPRPWMWRSAAFPSPGFAPYDVALASYSSDPNSDGDPNVACDDAEYNDLYVASFRLDGTVDAVCPGDVTGDNVVDLSDLAALLANFGSIGAGLPGDLDEDGDVELNDLATLLANFGMTCANVEPPSPPGGKRFTDHFQSIAPEHNLWCVYHIWRTNAAGVVALGRVYVLHNGGCCPWTFKPIFRDWAFRGAACGNPVAARGDWAWVGRWRGTPPAGRCWHFCQ